MRAREISPDVKSYDEVFETIRWQVPETFNIAADVCDRHAANPALAERKALLYEDKAGHTATFTFRALKELSDKLAGVLASGGLQRGGRAAVLMPQRPETALSHLAIYKLGAIAVPLTVLFRRDALLFRLRDSGAHTILLEAETLPLVEEILPGLPDLKSLIVVGGGGEAARI